jgi:hypothetical protein
MNDREMLELELVKLAVSQLTAWHKTYGAHNPDWIPPAGDVQFLEEAQAFISAEHEDRGPPAAMEGAMLLPCPLCHSENVEHVVSVDRGNQNVVRCLDCGCRVSSQFGGCIDTWNTRTAQTWQTAADVDCRQCANRGRARGLSQESFCDGCVWEGRTWRKDYFRAAAEISKKMGGE